MTRNLATALAEAGATIDDVAKLTLSMVDLRPETLEARIGAMFRAK